MAYLDFLNGGLSLENLLRRRQNQGQPEQSAPPLPPPPSGGGPFSWIGQGLQLVGSVANMAGQPYIGIPASVAGGAMKGGAEGGLTGALKQGGTTAAFQGLGQGLSALLAPAEAGATTVPGVSYPSVSSAGAPITVPGSSPLDRAAASKFLGGS